MENTEQNDPARELSLGPAIRDLIAGSGLIAIGMWLGHTSLDGHADPIDFVFDGLGIFWVLFGLYRLARIARARFKAPDRPRG